MGMLRIAVLVSLVAGPLDALAAQAPELPTVRLIATGGTIASRPSGRLAAHELTELVPTLGRFVQPEAEQYSNLPSSDLSLRDWLGLAQRINHLFDERPELAGIVVTSGTDTLEETAYFLHLTVQDTRPVVVVGSMRSPSTAGYDGGANLLQAFRVAAEPASRGRGVLVVLNAEINSAREVTKTDTQRLDTFGARGYGTLGVVDLDRIVYYRRSDRRHTAVSEFDISTVRSLPRVDIVLAYQEAPGDLILAAADGGAVGLVLAAAGAGSMSPSQRDAIDEVLDDGLHVVVASRTGAGRVVPSSLTGSAGGSSRNRGGRRRVMGEDLSPLKARILLMLALTRTQDDLEIQRMFEEY